MRLESWEAVKLEGGEAIRLAGGSMNTEGGLSASELSSLQAFWHPDLPDLISSARLNTLDLFMTYGRY